MSVLPLAPSREENPTERGSEVVDLHNGLEIDVDLYLSEMPCNDIILREVPYNGLNG